LFSRDEILNQTYYVPDKIKFNDYICSMDGFGGMKECKNLPEYVYAGTRCNASASMYGNNTPTNGSCVNWNQYYTECKPEAVNPYKGTVSFDNIGLAWVVIFQVSFMFLPLDFLLGMAHQKPQFCKNY
jgi:hypothetical protein